MILKQSTQQKTITNYNHSLSQKIHQLNMSVAGIDCQSSDYQITITEVLTICTTGIDCLLSLAHNTSRVTLLWFTQHGCTCHSQSVTLLMNQRDITEVLTISTTGIDCLVSLAH